VELNEDTCYTIPEETHTNDEVTEMKMEQEEPTILNTEERENYMKELEQNKLTLE